MAIPARASSETADTKTSKALDARRFSWRKLSAAKWSDSWLERLSFLGPQRAMVIEFPGARTVRVEAHGVTRSEADGLLKLFGGKVTEAKWLTAVDPPLRPPIRIRGKLVLLSTEKELEKHEAEGGKEIPIVITPGMAFGTGEHDTTATCLRFIADVAGELTPGAWEALDLGTGSGILAIAARKLGARSVDAADYDPHAVRTAKANAKANHIGGIKVKKLDVLEWTPKRTYPVVIANLFSGLLKEAAPKIASAIEPGGTFVFSGVLREQEAEVLAAVKRARLNVQRVVRKGKWVSGRAVKSGARKRSAAPASRKPRA